VRWKGRRFLWACPAASVQSFRRQCISVRLAGLCLRPAI
jgi:hypothetical protein